MLLKFYFFLKKNREFQILHGIVLKPQKQLQKT